MNTKLNQHGAVSLISVVIFATIITVLITAYLRSAVSQNNEAINYDFSTRAYYAAESGVQDATRLATEDKTTCTPIVPELATLGGDDFGLSYTCQLVSFTPRSLEGEVQPNGASMTVEIDPENNQNVANPTLVIRWSKQYEESELQSGAREALFPRDGTSPEFPPLSGWFAGGQDGNNGQPARPVHALLRAGVISHRDELFNRDGITQRVVFLNPIQEGHSSIATLNLAKSASIAEQQQQLMRNAACYSNNATTDESFDGYSCEMRIRLSGYDFSADKVYLHLGAIYKTADFSIELLDGADSVPLANAQYTVDVTGRAGQNVFRRIKQVVSLGGSAAHPGTDAALIAGEGICKQFALRADPNLFDPGCNP